MPAAVALLCGTLFGFGLALSGMTDVAKVIGFLDVTGAWDPTLAFVMGGGLLVSLPFFQFGLRRLPKTLGDARFRLPTRNDIDLPLLGGAMLFGVGWGLVGLCPGPAIASIAYLEPDLLWFLFAMAAGWLLTGRLVARSG